MGDIADAVTGLVNDLVSLDRWPFLSAMLIMTVVGQVMSTRVFTRERAYRKQWSQWVWYWGRETLPLHPLATGVCLGLVWPDPEGAGWPLIASSMYFGCAGVCSLFFWLAIKAYAKKHGIELLLPGSSVRPRPLDKP